MIRAETMVDQGSGKPTLTPAGRKAVEGRQERLAAALRENLYKRKAQQRSRSADSGLASDGPEAGASDLD